MATSTGNGNKLSRTEDNGWKWKGSVEELQEHLGRRFKKKIQGDESENWCEFQADFGWITFNSETRELNIAGDDCKTLLQILKSTDKCTLEECDEIYPHDHIKRRVGDERILGTFDQFCAAFYHVPKWNNYPDRRKSRNYACLDQKNCIIAKENRPFANPIKVVAVVKFENPRGKILYEARYTNCCPHKMHAENFFQNDIQDEDGVFNELIQDNPKGTITLYLTAQPCNLPRVTQCTKPDQSCCNILIDIVTRTLRENGRKIDLCVKAAHQNYLGVVQQKDAQLKKTAVEGTKDLITGGVKVSGMTQDDWDYLFTLTKDNKDRKHLDQEVEIIFRRIEENQE